MDKISIKHKEKNNIINLIIIESSVDTDNNFRTLPDKKYLQHLIILFNVKQKYNMLSGFIFLLDDYYFFCEIKT